MIGFALNIIAFIFIGFIALLILGSIISLFESNSNENDNKSINLLNSVFKAMKIHSNEIIPLDIDKEDFDMGIDEYYSVLKRVFDSETGEERKSLSSPSQNLSQAFYRYSGLNNSLNTITKDISYVIEGSGWTEYKKCLVNALKNGSLDVVKGTHPKYKVGFNKNLYMLVEKYLGWDDDNDNLWSVDVFYKNKEVLSCYGVGKDYCNPSRYIPGRWILDLRSVANKYAESREALALEQSTEDKKNGLFR